MKFFHLVGLTAILTGFYVYFAVLPYAYSPQSTLSFAGLTGRFDAGDPEGEFHGRKVQFIDTLPPVASAPENVLGAYRADKRIEVDLTNQKLYAFEGDNKIYEFLISSGKWGRTPTGEFTIWTKLRYTRMKGGNPALGTYYNLPNVPYTMYFSNAQVPSYRGYGIHGAYWHNNFGHPMSHGCINMRPEEAQQIYYWAQPDLPDGTGSVRASADNPGTRIVIYGTAPWQ
jgi:hypothetical protein